MYRNIKFKLIYAFLYVFTSFYGFFMSLFSRVKKYNKPDELNNQAIFVSWHSHLATLVFAMEKHHKNNIYIISSRHRSGLYISKVAERFGIKSIAGSSSKGGASATVKALSKIKEGACIFLTPDGPRGPAHTMKDGPAFLAQKSSLPVIPIAVDLSRKYIVPNRWDDLVVPKIITKVKVIYGKPVYFTNSIEETTENIRKSLQEANEALKNEEY